MNDLMTFVLSPAFVNAIIRMSTPLIFVSMAAVLGAKANILCIAYEGMMLFAALGGVIGSALSQNLLVGMLCGVLAGSLIAGLFAYFVLVLKTKDMLVGLALNTLGSGGTIFALYIMSGQKASSISLNSLQFPVVNIPIIKDIPVLGRIISGQSLLTYLAVLSVFLVWFLLKKTRIGLRIRAVGENPSAAESVGISVPKIGYISFAFCGVFAGLSGAFLSMSWVTFFMKNMVNGRGYIGLSAQNMAGGAPVGSALASLLFGFADSLSITLKNQTTFPTEFLNMIPYLATILAIIVTSIIAINKKRRIEKGTAKVAAEK